MTRTKFGLLFLVGITLITLAMNYFNLLEEAAKFLIILLLAAFFAGQYSMRFPKKD